MSLLTHGSLFSGIGGFDLAAEWMGWENKFHCEWNEFGQKVLKYYWPQAELFTDITKSDFTKYANTIDVLTGGFPCQPFSAAGKRKGETDDRYLWPEALRAIKEIKPSWIVFENVAGLFTILEQQSLSELEIKEVQLFCEDKTLKANETIVRVQQRVIATIIKEIRAAGYILPTLTDGTPILLCIPACAVNAPHRRDRIWFVAYSKSFRTQTGATANERKEYFAHNGNGIRNTFNTISDFGNVANSHSNGQQRSDSEHEINTSERGFNALNDIEHIITSNTNGSTTRPPERVKALKEAGAETMMSRKNGECRPNSILDAMDFYGMLPTPKNNDFRSGMQNRHNTEHTQQLNDTMAFHAGKTSQLNPQFVMEMMGFPADWTLLPFLNGEVKV